MIKTGAAIFYSALLTTWSLSHATPSDELQTCANIKVAKDRLACFDRLAAAPKTETKSTVLAAVQSAKALVADRFKDPSSVQFRNLVAYGTNSPPSLSMLCGQVNGKNSYGGFVGFRRFVTNGGASVEVEDAENSRSMNRLWESTCSGTEIYTE